MTCLVTGAGSGIGRTVALLLAARQPVAVVDVDPARLAETAGLVREQGGRCVAVPSDVRDVAACERAVEEALVLGPLTDLVCAAGTIRGDGPLTETTAEVWHDLLAVNLVGTANVVRAALPAMMASGGGDVVLVSSIGAVRGRRRTSAYAASKAGVLGLATSLVADYADRGIRTNCVCPGATATPMVARPGRPDVPELNAAGRLATPAEVANVIVWLTEEASDWVVGAVVPADGGETAVAAGTFNWAG